MCTDIAGNITYVNDIYSRKFHYITSDFVGKPTSLVVHPDDIEFVRQAGQKCLTEKDLRVPITLRKADGAGGYLVSQWEFKGIFDESGRPVGVFCLGFDITDFSLEVGKKEKLLKEIAFQQSHVLRRPVANILGLYDILKDAELSADHKHLITLLYESAIELDEMIQDITKSIDDHDKPAVLQ